MIHYKPILEKKLLQLHYMDNDRFVMSINTKYILKDLQTLDYLFDLSTSKEKIMNFSVKERKSDW